ncbi:hypothetical protein ACFU8Q_08680 [Streptomyces sp. NPDC057543]|uniref:hypothetical protein n=1 Tax=Streptomyces sp. NPDC057543 TaxID=3346163 RepID=UPI0036D201C4
MNEQDGQGRQERADAVDREMAARLLPHPVVRALGRWWETNAAAYAVGAPSHLRLPGRTGPVPSLAVCPAEDGSSLLVTGGSDGCVRLWSPDAPRTEAYPVLKGHHGPVSAIDLLPPTPTSPQPLLATAGSSDTTVRLWNRWTGEELMRVVTGTPLTSLRALPDGGMPDTTDPAIAFGGPAGLAALTLRR